MDILVTGRMGNVYGETVPGFVTAERHFLPDNLLGGGSRQGRPRD